LISFLAILVTWSYAIYQLGSSDPRFTDGVLTTEEMHWWEVVLTFLGAILPLSLVLSALYHAFVMTRRIAWGVLIAVLWPLCFLYGWLNYPHE
jgi:hypothetical protein